MSTGHLFVRYSKALIAGRGSSEAAAAYAAGSGWPESRAIAAMIKSSVAAISSAVAGDALHPIGLDFAEFLRPQTLIGRIPGFRTAFINVRMVVQTSGAAGAFVTEGSPIPVSAAGFEQTAILGPSKAGAIAVITSELARMSTPAADDVMAADIGRAVGLAIDLAFINPANVGDSATPAAVTSGAPSFVSSGTTVAAIDADLALLLRSVTDASIPLDSAVWIMPSRTAAAMALLRGSGGAPAYPGMRAAGGSLLGLPVFTSDAARQSGSPDDGCIVLLVPDNVMVADDGMSVIDIAEAATLQMVTGPSGGATAQVSLWQNGLVGIRGQRIVNWERRRPEGAAVLVGVSFEGGRA